jgi:hypothetical protein
LSYTHSPGFIFPSGSTQKYRVKAKNNIGLALDTAFSAELLVTADEVPIRMNNPTRHSVTPNSIKIQWSTISLDADTGRDSVVFYHVKWEQSTGSWVTLTNWPTQNTIETEFTHVLTGSNIFPSGSTQNYRVYARNGVGDGAYGSVAITADFIP